MKASEMVEEAASCLQELAERIAFLSILEVKADKGPDLNLERPDLVATVNVGETPWTLALICLPQAQPREARIAMLRLEHILHRLPQPNYGVIVAPFMSEATVELCAEAGFGTIDLAGNQRLTFGSIYVEIRTAGNPNVVRREARSLFSPKAERVLIQLLTPPVRSWKVIELAEAAHVSLGHVSAVRQLLLSREWAEAGNEGIRLSQPKAVADAWQAAYVPRLHSITRGYTLLHGDDLQGALQSALYDAGRGEHAVLGSYSAAKWIAPPVRHGTLYLYADAAGREALLSHLQLEPAGSAANVILMDPKSDSPFADRIEPSAGVWTTGLLQTWLDLGAEGPRGKEAAQRLYEHAFAGAWQ